MIADDHDEAHVEEENYFISMTDMMVGLVFVFIILLMYFTLQTRSVTDQLTSADRTRTELLQEIKRTLDRQGVEVTIDTHNGVLRLPNKILFESKRTELKPDGRAAVSRLADALATVMPCYVDRGAPCSSPARHRVESVFVEGHADSDRFAGRGELSDNFDLSVIRATNTYRALIAHRPELATYATRGAPVLSVSGYGDLRPVPGATDKEQNRRIDLRLLMAAPDGGEVRAKVEARAGGR